VSVDALDRDTIRKALEGVEAVIQTLGVDISPRAIFELRFGRSCRLQSVLPHTKPARNR
jgi:hypothetical protein